MEAVKAYEKSFRFSFRYVSEKMGSALLTSFLIFWMAKLLQKWFVFIFFSSNYVDFKLGDKVLNKSPQMAYYSKLH